MKNKLFLLVSGMAILLFAACNNGEKAKVGPATSSQSVQKTISTQQSLTPGQIHNQILGAYLQQYGIVGDNQITMAEAETLCERIAQVTLDQGFMNDMTAADLADNLYDDYVNSGAFANGILKPTNELITIAIDAVPNADIRNAFNQIHYMAGQDDPDFVQNATQLLDDLSGLDQDEQQMVYTFKSILQSSYDLWTAPNTPKPSYLPTGALWYQVVAMADAAGAIRAYYSDWVPGATGAIEADEKASTGAAKASGAAAH